jgi:hypothetical protein
MTSGAPLTGRGGALTSARQQQLLKGSLGIGLGTERSELLDSWHEAQQTLGATLFGARWIVKARHQPCGSVSNSALPKTTTRMASVLINSSYGARIRRVHQILDKTSRSILVIVGVAIR